MQTEHISTTELEALAGSIRESLRDAKRLIHAEIEAQVIGLTVEVSHVEDADHAAGYGRTLVLATVVRTRWTYDDELLLVVTYPHPRTGDAVEGERSMW